MKLRWPVGNKATVLKRRFARNAQFNPTRDADSGEYESVGSGLKMP